MIRWLDGKAMNCVLPSDTAVEDKDKTVFVGTPMNREASNIADQVMRKRLIDIKSAVGSDDPKKLGEELTRLEFDQMAECIDKIVNAPGGVTLTKKTEIRECFSKMGRTDFGHLYSFFVDGSGLATLERKSSPS